MRFEVQFWDYFSDLRSIENTQSYVLHFSNYIKYTMGEYEVGWGRGVGGVVKSRRCRKGPNYSINAGN